MSSSTSEVEVGHWEQVVRSYLVELGALDEVDWRLALLALQPQDVVGVAPAQDGRPLDVSAVHAADACGARKRAELMELVRGGRERGREGGRERVPTLLLAVDHHEAELVGQAADGSRGQSQEGAEPLAVRLAEANHWVRRAGRAHVLAPLEAFDPRQRALQGSGGEGRNFPE